MSSLDSSSPPLRAIRLTTAPAPPRHGPVCLPAPLSLSSTPQHGRHVLVLSSSSRVRVRRGAPLLSCGAPAAFSAWFGWRLRTCEACGVVQAAAAAAAEAEAEPGVDVDVDRLRRIESPSWCGNGGDHHQAQEDAADALKARVEPCRECMCVAVCSRCAESRSYAGKTHPKVLCGKLGEVRNGVVSLAREGENFDAVTFEEAAVVVKLVVRAAMAAGAGAVTEEGFSEAEREELHVALWDLEANMQAGARDAAKREAVCLAIADLLKPQLDVLGLVPHDVTRLHAAVLTNSFAVSGNEPYGLAVYPTASFFNHSCYPTAARSTPLGFTGLQLRVVALRDLEPGEEVSIRYLETGQAELRAHYGFTCACARCSSPSGWRTAPLSPFSCPSPCHDGAGASKCSGLLVFRDEVADTSRMRCNTCCADVDAASLSRRRRRALHRALASSPSSSGSASESTVTVTTTPAR